MVSWHWASHSQSCFIGFRFIVGIHKPMFNTNLCLVLSPTTSPHSSRLWICHARIQFLISTWNLNWFHCLQIWFTGHSWTKKTTTKTTPNDRYDPHEVKLNVSSLYGVHVCMLYGDTACYICSKNIEIEREKLLCYLKQQRIVVRTHFTLWWSEERTRTNRCECAYQWRQSCLIVKNQIP